MYDVFKVLKEEFRQWYGLLSIEEIMSNTKLIESISMTEKVMGSVEKRFGGI